MKPFTISIIRDIIDQYDREEISYSRMVELFNERAIDYFKNKCPHSNIEHVTIHPTDGKICQADATFFRCVDCGVTLPINSISEKIINVPLY